MSVAAAVTSPISAVTQQPIRVMVVDDAVVVRGLVSRWVNAEPDLKIVASLRTGQDALDELDHADPEVVLLDVEMPVLDGITALPLLLQRRSNLAVIMVSTVTRRNAEVTLKALSLGAADYVSETGNQPRNHHVRNLPPRTDREDPPHRMAPPRAEIPALKPWPGAGGTAAQALAGGRHCGGEQCPCAAAAAGAAWRSNCGRWLRASRGSC